MKVMQSNGKTFDTYFRDYAMTDKCPLAVQVTHQVLPSNNYCSLRLSLSLPVLTHSEQLQARQTESLARTTGQYQE